MRHPYWGYYVDDLGNSIANGNVSIYLAGTTTPAKIYLTETDPTPIETPPQLTTDEHGFFAFWVDEADYSLIQRFRIVLEKEGYQTVDLDNIAIFRGLQLSSLAESNPSLDGNPLKDINFLTLNPLTEEPEPALNNKLWFEPYRIRYKDDAGDLYVIATQSWALRTFQYRHLVRVPSEFESLNDAVGWVYDKGQGIVFVEVTTDPIEINEPVELKPGVWIIGGHGRARPDLDKYSTLIANVSPAFKFDYYEYQVDTVTVTKKVTILNVIANLQVDGQNTQATFLDAETIDFTLLRNLKIRNFTGTVINMTGGQKFIAEGINIEGGTTGINLKADNSLIKTTTITGVGKAISIGGINSSVIFPLIFGADIGIEVVKEGARIQSPYIVYCNNDGISVNAITCTITGGEIYNNGQAGAGYAGVRLTSNALYCKVRGVKRLGNVDTPYTQSYGVIEEGGADYNEISGNVFLNNTEQAYIVKGFKTVFFGNIE